MSFVIPEGFGAAVGEDWGMGGWGGWGSAGNSFLPGLWPQPAGQQVACESFLFGLPGLLGRGVARGFGDQRYVAAMCILSAGAGDSGSRAAASGARKSLVQSRGRRRKSSDWPRGGDKAPGEKKGWGAPGLGDCGAEAGGRAGQWVPWAVAVVLGWGWGREATRGEEEAGGRSRPCLVINYHPPSALAEAQACWTLCIREISSNPHSNFGRDYHPHFIEEVTEAY